MPVKVPNLYELVERTAILTEKQLLDPAESKYTILANTCEELGEVSRATRIEDQSHTKKHKVLDESSSSESVDLAICSLSLFFANGGTMTEMLDVMQKKLDKWQSNLERARPMPAVCTSMTLEEKWSVHKRAEELSLHNFCGRSTQASLVKSGRMKGLSELYRKYERGLLRDFERFVAYAGYAGCIIRLAVRAPAMSDEDALLIRACLLEDLHLHAKGAPAPAGEN